ncbi:TPA: hypothetical protein ACJTPC_001730 [Providencia alcalifaciens]
MFKFIQQTIGLGVVIIIGLYLYGNFDEKTKPNQDIEISYPKSESDFVNITKSYIKKTNDAKNDLQIAALKSDRNKQICKKFNGDFKVNNWVGKVVKLGSSSSGKGSIDIELSKNIKIGTWSNDFSDGRYSTLIDQETTLFNKALGLNKGDLVRFSGTFIKDTDECIREKSVTQNGGMTEPEFIFRFSDISKI